MHVTVIIALLSFLSGGTFVFLFAKRRLEKDEYITILRIEKAINNERLRIAGELHDSLIQRLSAIRLRLVHTLLYSLRPEVENEIVYAKDNMENEIAEIRRIIKNELEPYFTTETISKLIGDLCSSFSNIIGWKLEYVCVNAEREFYISPAIKKELFRIIQQAMQNTISHGLGDTLSVVLRWATNLTIVIHDNGKGYIGNKKGLGSKFLLERAKRIGATIDIISTYNGVKVKIELKRRHF